MTAIPACRHMPFGLGLGLGRGLGLGNRQSRGPGDMGYAGIFGTCGTCGEAPCRTSGEAPLWRMGVPPRLPCGKPAPADGILRPGVPIRIGLSHLMYFAEPGARGLCRRNSEGR